MTKDNLPTWYKNSKEKIPEIHDSLTEINNSGISDIQRGLAKIRYVETVENDYMYLSSFFSNYSGEQHNEDEIVSSLGSILGGTIINLANETSRMRKVSSADWNNGEIDQLHVQSMQASTDISSASAVYITYSIEERIKSLDTSYEPIAKVFPPERLSNHEEILSTLKAKLLRFGKKNLTLLESSEESLLRNTLGDNIASAHSMRECFNNILNILAPEKIVKIQPWFLVEYAKARGVPRIAQLMYIARNSKKKFVKEDLQIMESEMTNAKFVMETCVKIAHGHFPEGGLDTVRSSIDLLRYYLLTILNLGIDG